MEFQGLSFSAGLATQELIRHRFAAPVTHSVCDRTSFFLVAAFGRCKFRLIVASVGFLLQAAIGGSPSHFFFVSQLDERTFKFADSSKPVGLFVANLRSFSCAEFKVYFFLWGNGGPNWRAEHKLFLLEEERSWTASTSRPGRRSYAEAVKTSVLSGANAVPLGPSSSTAAMNSTSARYGANAGPSSSSAAKKSVPVLSGANAVPLGRAPMKKKRISVHDRIIFPRNPAPSSPSMGDVRRQTRLCSRCLSQGHWRVNCRWPIRCRVCRKTGHVAERQQNRGEANGKNTAAQEPGWLRLDSTAQPSTTSPPSFTAPGDLSRVPRPTRDNAPILSASGRSGPNNTKWAEPGSGGGINNALDPKSCLLFLSSSSSHQPPLHSGAPTVPQENPAPFHHASLLDLNHPPDLTESMAFQRADPTLFIPEHLEHQDIPNR